MKLVIASILAGVGGGGYERTAPFKIPRANLRFSVLGRGNFGKMVVKPCFVSHGFGLWTFIVEQTDSVNN